MDRLSSEIPDDLLRADQILAEGGIVAVPTETVYGLAADARRKEAVEKIFHAKGRPWMDPLIVHFYDPDQILEYCYPHPLFEKLATVFWPGPLTLVLLLRSNKLDPVVSAGMNTLGVRIPAHPVLRKLLSLSKRPLAAPSANPFGYISPTRPEHVIQQLENRIDAVLQAGPCQHGLESTILSLANSEDAGPTLLRPGPISIAEMEGVIGQSVSTVPKRAKSSPLAPGMLDSHYSPSKPLHLLDLPSLQKLPHKEGLKKIYLCQPQDSQSENNAQWLSVTGDPKEMAQNLFHILRTMDTDKKTTDIYVEFPERSDGLYAALRDRLTRAAHKTT